MWTMTLITMSEDMEEVPRTSAQAVSDTTPIVSLRVSSAAASIGATRCSFSACTSKTTMLLNVASMVLSPPSGQACGGPRRTTAASRATDRSPGDAPVAKVVGVGSEESPTLIECTEVVTRAELKAGDGLEELPELRLLQ